MDILFLHPNFPGQFGRLATALAQTPGIRVVALADAVWVAKREGVCPGVELFAYQMPDARAAQALMHPWAKPFEQAVQRGHAAIQSLMSLKASGFEPDLVVAHPGWGDAFFVRDLFPVARVLGYMEYYYRPRGADVGFDPEFPASVNDRFRLHALNATQLLAWQSCDALFCPTDWQRGQFPPEIAQSLEVIHEGIDTRVAKPDPRACVVLPNQERLYAGDEVLTFVSRSLEPYRGIHSFMRSLPAILAARPQCRVLIVGEEGQSYGPKPPDGRSWKRRYVEEVLDRIDPSRVHFLGRLPHAQYLKVLQVSRCHVYLSYPFVVSWSLLEALAVGCVVVASDTAPVREVLSHGETGWLVPFASPSTIAQRVVGVLSDPQNHEGLGRAARADMVQRFDFATCALPAFACLLQLEQPIAAPDPLHTEPASLDFLPETL